MNLKFLNGQLNQLMDGQVARLPINFRYSLVEKGNPEPVLNSGFTVAYCTISNEHYEGETPTSEQPVSETQPAPGQAASDAPPLLSSAPAFSLVTGYCGTRARYFSAIHSSVNIMTGDKIEFLKIYF